MSRERPVVEDGDAGRPATTVTRAESHIDEEPTDDSVSRALGERVAELERELERREHRHNRVVERYERLLADAREEEPDEGGYVDWVRSLL